MVIKEKVNTTNKNNLENKFLPLTVILYLLMFINGISVTMIGPLMPVFVNQYEISISTSGLIILLKGIGALMALISGLAFAGMVRKSLLINIIFGIFIVSILLVSLEPSYIILLIFFFFTGASISLLDAVLNAYIAEMHSKKLGFYINLLHASFGVGALLGPFFSNAFIVSGLSWNTIFLTLAIFSSVILVFYILVQRIIPIDYKISESTRIYDVLILLKNKNMLILCFITFLFGGFAVASSTWMPTYMIQQMKSNAFISIIPVTLFWTGIITGRIVYSLLSLRFSIKYLLFFNSLLGGMALTAAIILNKPIGFIIGFILIGFLIGTIPPLSITLACSFNKWSNTLISTIIILSVNAGAMFIPWILGIIADNAGFLLFMISLAIIPFAISLATIFINRPKEI